MILCALLCTRKHTCFQRRFRSKESGKKNRMIPKKVGVRNHENGSLIDCRMKYDHDSRESSIMMKNKKGFSLKLNSSGSFVGKKCWQWQPQQSKQSLLSFPFPLTEKSSQINGTFRIRLKKCIPSARYAAAAEDYIFRYFVSAGTPYHRFAGGLWQRWDPVDLRTGRFPGGGHQFYPGNHRPSHFHCLPLRWKPFRSGNNNLLRQYYRECAKNSAFDK